MKKFRILIATLLVAGLLVACGGEGSTGGNTDGAKKIAFVTNTGLGDNSLADVIWAGVKKAEAEFGMEAQVVELGEDATKQVPTLQELAETEEYEVIVAGTYNLKESVEQVAAEFPDQKFIAPDVEINFEGGINKNVASFMSAQNEGSFLGGALAALMTSSGHEYTNGEKVIGYIGGAENTAINDFLVGYIEGAKYVDADVKVLFSYIGDFSNSAKGKELALAQFDRGADIVYAVAGGAGFGALDAANQAGKFALGVDQDQGAALAKNNPEAADHVLTSVQKNMDVTVYEYIKGTVEGTLEYGKHTLVGVADNGMSLSDNETFQKHVPAEFQEQIKDIQAKITSGEIKVSTAIGITQEEMDVFKTLAGSGK